METTTRCPACGHTGTLIALGTRRMRPHRWRFWISIWTDLFLCAHCAALVVSGPSGHLVVESRPQPENAPAGVRPQIGVYAGGIAAEWPQLLAS